MQDEVTVYSNGTIHTMDNHRPRAEAMVVRGDRIAAVGSRDEIGSNPGARRIELDGRTVIPGFNDSHAHILAFGRNLEELDVSADAVRTVGDIVRAVRERARHTPPGQWIIGQGYNQNELEENRHPAAHDLDDATANHPVVLHHTSGHVLTCNSGALQRAGITADTKDPPGGRIERDEHGKPTGLLKELAMDLVEQVIPARSASEGARDILRAMEMLARYGITSASDAATGQGPSIEPELEMYRAALRSGTLAGRITLMPQIAYVAPRDSSEVGRPSSFDVGEEPDWLRIGATKIFSDGALSTRTAAMREPYKDSPGDRGILLWERADLISCMRRAHAAGWQIATHALGDRAVEMVLECYQEAMAPQPRRDHRHRIEHCMYADEHLGRRIRDLGIVPSLQPDIYRLGDGYVAALGLERASQSIPTGLFRRLGITVSFSSDLPVIPGRPLDVIRSATERRTPRGIVLGLEHSVPVMESIRFYTRNGGFATHTEAKKGTLRPGMLADFAVLSRDPAITSLEDWDSIAVTMTVAGGRVTYAP